MNYYIMKQIALIIFFFSISSFIVSQQKTNYEALWKKAEELIYQKQLPKSALKEVENIYSIAKKEKNEGQLLKAMLYRFSWQEANAEDGAKNKILQLEKEISVTEQPARSILQSITASAYHDYYNNHRWDILKRTSTKNFEKKDIDTWSSDDFHKKISQLYLASIKEKALLQNTNPEQFEAVIIKGNTPKLRPTLFDLLAFRALEYFGNDERDINKPAYAFKLDMAAVYDPAADFVNKRFITKDSSSLYHKALLIYQQLLAFHLHDKTPDALIDADLLRLKFVHQYSVHPDKNKLYELALLNIADQYGNVPAADEARYLLARFYADKARDYKPFGDTTYRMYYVKAKEICDKVVLRKDSTEGKMHCMELLQQIGKKSLELTSEKVNLPAEPFRTLVTYRNINKIYFRLIRISAEFEESLNNYYDNHYWQKLTNLKAERKWEQLLPETNDYQQHSTEIKVDAMSAGKYALLASVTEDFSLTENLLAVQFVYVSSISYINNELDYFVLDRNTGKPLANAKVQIYEMNYNYNERKNQLQKKENYTTDKNGYFKLLVSPGNSRNIRLEITYNKETFFLNDQNYGYKYRSDEPVERDWLQTFFFTDRSIYRPGQTVYFKGIVVKKNNQSDKTDIVPNSDMSVQLFDANNQLKETINVRTNEFGSYSGKFTLPTGLMNGNFRLHDTKSNNDYYFKVEEYKRPKFYVEFDKVKGSYRVNDSIVITGKAKAYAGNNIDGAEVKFRVQRKARFNYPWYKWGWWPQRQSSQEISSGIITTAADGSFNIRFKAIPDESIDKKEDPLFDFEISADVTDINGETRSGNSTVTVSYKSLFIDIKTADKMPADSFRQVLISSKNQSNEFEQASLHIKIYKLKQPHRLIRERYWKRPDLHIMNQDEYYLSFPYDNYDNDDEPTSWPKQLMLEQSDFITKEKDSYYKPSAILEAGIYIIEVTGKDKYNEDVKAIKQIELSSSAAISLPNIAYWWSDKHNITAEPGERVNFNIGSSADDLFLICTTANRQQNNNQVFDFLNLNNQIKTISLSPTEADRGGTGFGLAFVKHNRFFSENFYVNVPWTNKELKIEVATYRNKTEPGSYEKWKVKISGYRTDRVAAELLTSMYDASLDQFNPHQWSKPQLWRSANLNFNWQSSHCFSQVISNEQIFYPSIGYEFSKEYDKILYKYSYLTLRKYSLNDFSISAASLDITVNQPDVPDYNNAAKKKELTGLVSGIDVSNESNAIKKDEINNDNIQIRKNFNETAFFFPDLQTDSSGNIAFSFTMPEALTKWKWMMLGHTKDLSFGYEERTAVTQKTLMLQPNAPRFFREGDKIVFSSKLVNLSDKELTGTVTLQLLNASTLQSVDGWFMNYSPLQYFTIAAGQSQAVNFKLEIPINFNDAVIYRLVAKAAGFSDGEEMAVPVLTNRMLVTESLPIYMRGDGTKKISFDKLKNAPQHSTLTHYHLTAEYTSNPAWYVVQALPYLMEFPYECAEQTFNRFYATAIAGTIVNASPRFKAVLEKWKTTDTAALMSNLQKNEELKSVLLQETPWVMEANNEAQQKKNIALLFDMAQLGATSEKTLGKLIDMQSPNGGFMWFKGGPDDRYITQYILTGIGHLKKINALNQQQQTTIRKITDKAITYLDARIKEDYNELIKRKIKLSNNHLSYTAIQYLYMRSFFPEYAISQSSITAFNYYRTQAIKYWQTHSLYMQGMIALALNRYNETKTPKAILASLKEKAIVKDEMGMYWKEMQGGYYWYEAPVETMSLLIEAFSEVGKESKAVDDMRTWLLKNKQTNNWKTTKATAEACYAFLLNGSDFVSESPTVEIKMGDITLKSTEEKQEAGTGYFKRNIAQNNIDNSKGDIQLTVSGSNNKQSSSWGAVYWQYFEDLDKITVAETPLKLSKKLFVERNSDNGPVLIPVNENDVVQIGDKIKVRIELRVDRDMEYVHMKDMRASCMEPVNVISSYKWQGGLGYYESTKDASTNFFFSWLPRGTYVFEYPLFITNKGDFSNGITTIQCMYAPEFSAHSEGLRVRVE